MFAQLRQVVQQNIQAMGTVRGGIVANGVDAFQAIAAGQGQMLITLDEIERQANVGIGYAFSAEYVLAEPCMSRH